MTPMGDRPGEQDFLLSTLAPSHEQKRLALWVAGGLLVALLATVPFAHRPLADTEALLPAYATAMLINDVITSALLFALYSIERSRAVLALSIGYLFTGLTSLPWALTFPGVFAPTGLLDASLQSTAWIAAARRIAFPALILLYVGLKDTDFAVQDARHSTRATIVASVLATVAVTCGLTWLIVAGDDSLPRFMLDARHASAVWQSIPISSALICVAALAALWIRRKSTLDLWLMIVLYTLLIEIALLAFLGSGRFSVGWWAGRAYGLISASVVLVVLLSEITTLYARLARSVLVERCAREARLTTMETFSASIAHEVNQPLASMVTNADAGLRWLAKPEPDIGEAKAALQRIVGDGHRAGDVIESIRTMFRKDARERVPLDVNALIAVAVECLQDRAQTTGIAIRAELDGELPLVPANAVQLRQVVSNLLANAMDAMDSFAGRPHVLVIRSESQGAEGILVSVEDSGIGLSPAEHGRIFEPFYTTKPGGMGMGLMFCRAVVEAHGGRLWATDNRPSGTIFRFTLPGDGGLLPPLAGP